MCAAEAHYARDLVPTTNDVPQKEVLVLLQDPAMPLQLEIGKLLTPIFKHVLHMRSRVLQLDLP